MVNRPAPHHRLKKFWGALTSQPQRPCVAVLGRNSSPGEDRVEQHPEYGQAEEDDEEDLPVHGGDGGAVDGAAADQSSAQDEDVDAQDDRQRPAAPVPRCGGGSHCRRAGSWSGPRGNGIDLIDRLSAGRMGFRYPFIPAGLSAKQ